MATPHELDKAGKERKDGLKLRGGDGTGAEWVGHGEGSCTVNFAPKDQHKASKIKCAHVTLVYGFKQENIRCTLREHSYTDNI